MRSDGRKLKTLGGFDKLVPFIMSKRVDSQNYTRVELCLDAVDEFIKRRRREGVSYSYMTILIAAYLRMICAFPELNRFVVRKRIYARNNFTVSFVVLKRIGPREVTETVAKVTLERGDTLGEVHAKLSEAIKKNRDMEFNNSMDRFVSGLTGIPLLPSLIVGLLKALDQIGLMPKAVIRLSPFHTSLFCTNMASLGMDYIYHHCYEFGTTSVFVAMGRKKRQTEEKGEKAALSVGVVTDERICPGITYSRALKTISALFSNPEKLEERPEKIVDDIR